MTGSDDLPDRLGPLDPHELLVQAAVEVAESIGVEAELVQDRSMEALDVEPVRDGGAAELVGLADAGAARDAAAGQPHGEAVRVMIAAGPFLELGGGLAAELAAPDDQGLVEQAAALEVLDQAGDGLVGVAGVLGVVGDEVGVGVPVVVVVRAAGIDLDEPHAALDQPPGDQALAAEVGGPGLIDTVE